MKNFDRWKQRLQNLNQAMKRLEEACGRDEYSDLETAGLVQTWQFTFELSWKTMKDRLTIEGYDVTSPRDTIRQAFAMGWIANAEEWLEALETRNLLTHTYNQELAQQAIEVIRKRLWPMARASLDKLNQLAAES